MGLFFVEDDIYENYFFIQKYASLQKYLKIKMVSFVFCPNECSGCISGQKQKEMY